MELREFGRTGLKITPLGLGLAEISRQDRMGGDVSAGAAVLNEALDNGINFLDTAACYADTEALIGETVSHRRDEYVLATKAGHAVGNAPGESWARETIEHSIDRSLRLLQTDYVDIVQLHSCDVEVLERGDAIDAVVRAREAGKTRFVSFSGDNEAAKWAVKSGIFATLQTSYNVVEQHARTKGVFDMAQAAGMGVILKRPVANGAWWKDESPYPYADEYFRRSQLMKEAGPFEHDLDDQVLLVTGFALAEPAVTTIITGTHNVDHLKSNIDLVANHLPISDATVRELHGRFEQVEDDWRQLT
ncbi:MAG: aldo/keto reductase [Chloroflexi bacterium]|nr:aldo/keto reductase [Chloroflexota bacterium]